MTVTSEVDALRAALWTEWLGNHDEHCTNRWPHRLVVLGCYYPMPDLLADYQPTDDEMPYFRDIEYVDGETASQMWDRCQR